MYLKQLVFTLALVGSSFCAFSLDSLADITSDAKPVIETSKVPAALTETKKETIAPPAAEATSAPLPKTVAPADTTIAPAATTTAPPKTTGAPAKEPAAVPDSTTGAPNTTTTPAPTPAPQPGQWFVKENNVTCIVAKMFINLTIDYPVGNKTSQLVVPIEGNGTAVEAKGSCGADNQTLEISFGKGHSVLLTFHNKTTQFAISSIKLTVNASDLPNAKENGTLVYNETNPLFETPITMSFKCNKLQTVNLTNTAYNLTTTFNITDTQLQAFRVDASTDKFADAQDCEPLDTPDMVPIAVGVSLGVMILVVLIAYLIGRRRVGTSGYVSM